MNIEDSGIFPIPQLDDPEWIRSPRDDRVLAQGSWELLPAQRKVIRRGLRPTGKTLEK